MRRFFRFSVRDLLWLTLVVALGLGWFVSERQARAEVDRLQAEADKARGDVYKWEQLAVWKDSFRRGAVPPEVWEPK